MPGEYVGSRGREINAMLAQIVASDTDSGSDPPSPAARTDGLEAEGRKSFATRQLTPRFALAWDDLDAVEHERQSRLRRWHTQP